MVNTTQTAGPASARAAATILLLREGAQGLEVFMQQRTRTMAFAGGVAAFPGGSVDATDHEGTEDWLVEAPSDLDDAGGPASTGPVTAAALRETFEESGVLLTRGAGGPAARDPEALGAARAALSAHTASVSDVVARLGLSPDLGGLHYVDRWVTPEGLPRRYDTRFVAARLPAGQEPGNLSTESVRSFWIRPADALYGYAEGSLELMQPTWAQLRRLAAAPSAQEALEPAGTGVTRHKLIIKDGQQVAWGEGTEEYLAAGPQR